MLPDGRVIVLYVCDYIPYSTPGCQPERGIVRAPWHAASVYQQHRDELRRELHNKLRTNATAKTSYIGCNNEKKRFSDLNDNDKRITRGKDHWQDQGTCWVRAHYEPRTSLFSLSSLKDGKSHILKPKPDDLTDDRITYYWEVDTMEPGIFVDKTDDPIEGLNRRWRKEKPTHFRKSKMERLYDLHQEGTWNAEMA